MYVRLCETLSDKGQLVPRQDDIYKYVKNTKKDYYTSVYYYNEEQKKQFDKSGTIAGITEVVTDKIIFDFDSKKDVEQARKDALIVVDRLSKRGIGTEDINIFFSGHKGYHLVLNTNQDFTPDETKLIAKGIAGDLQTFDTVVYNSNRVLRLANTMHPETHLYKIRIGFDELQNSNTEVIKHLAKDEWEVTEDSTLTLTPETIKRLYESEVNLTEKTKIDHVVESTLLSDLDLTKRPSNMSPWKYALEQGFFPPGQRSHALTILAATYKSLGYSKIKCHHLLKAVVELQSAKFNQEKFDKKELFNKTVNQVYKDSWGGGTYAEDNFPQEIQDYLKKLGVPRKDESDIHENYVVDIGKGFGAFTKYAEMIDENTMKFGIKDLDNALRVQVGHLIGILAGPGLGKTSLALTLLNNTSKQGIKSFFGSYDMASNILIQKLVQRETRLDIDEVYDIFRNKKKEDIDRVERILTKNYDNVSFCFKSGQSIKELKDSIRQEEVKSGKEVKLVIVDYIELIRTKSLDPTISSMEAIQGLREIANEGKVVVCLLQPNKVSSTPDEPLLSYNAAKGSSAIAQAVTSMISCHRPAYFAQNPTEDVYFSINIIKNRMGPLGSADFSWEGITGRIGQLEDIQKRDLGELRALKKANKDDDI